MKWKKSLLILQLPQTNIVQISAQLLINPQFLTIHEILFKTILWENLFHSWAEAG